jgi:hypothetical protein
MSFNSGFAFSNSAITFTASTHGADCCHSPSFYARGTGQILAGSSRINAATGSSQVFTGGFLALLVAIKYTWVNIMLDGLGAEG